MNDNAIAKLREANLCILLCLVPRAPVLHGTEEHCIECWVVACCSLVVFFVYSVQKVSGQQILEACLRNFEGILSLP